MSLSVPDYPNQFSPTPLAEACAWVERLDLDFGSGAGSVGVAVHADAPAAAAGYPPIARIPLALGQGGMPTLAEFLADNAAAFDAIRAYLYSKLAAMGQFPGATEVA